MKPQFKLILCVASLILTIACSVYFGVEYIKQYRWEKKLSSIESVLGTIPVLKTDSSQVDPLFLQNSFAQLPLLNLERGSLELLATQRALSDQEKQRLLFLNEENIILFRTQRKVGSEVEEKLLHTVQIDENDLPKILEILEGDPAASIRIKRLHLQSHPSLSIYNLYLELWRKDS